MTDYPADTGQPLSTWLDEWAKMEAKRLHKARAAFPAWLAAQDKSTWHDWTHEEYVQRYVPYKGVLQ